MIPRTRFLLVALAAGCGSPNAHVEEGEWLPGGDATNTVLQGIHSFSLPSPNLTADHAEAFYAGNSFFNEGWVEAPSSTTARDGLGPLMNARSCSGCHFRDGRATVPEDGQGPFIGLLLRLSVPSEAGPTPDPVYGGQLQDIGIPGVLAEATPSIAWTEQPGSHDDGAAWSLAAPTYTLGAPAYGPFPADLQFSPRLAPQMIGLGLLEAITDADLEVHEDPDDADGDGISGRLQLRTDPETGEPRTGRFGWKADAPSVAAQTAGAFAGDLGLTSRLVTADDCTEAQEDCRAQESGGSPEVSDEILDRVILYARSLAVPARRHADDAVVLEGKQRFHDLGCAGCHTPSYTTGSSVVAELGGQRIWPYTDLLLHDMGDALADGRPLGLASGNEWKTPPLWGLGLIDEVSGAPARFLHDGRARSLEEAILWHGGEAEPARDGYSALDAEDRAALLAFLEDL